MHALRRTLVHDWPVIALALSTLAGIGLYLQVGPTLHEGAGYRVIDTAKVRRLQDSGELSTREARWYHPAESQQERSAK
jgi:hypothetical protein